MKAASLRINLFGEFRVWRGEDLIQNGEWGGWKTRSLLKLLLTQPGRTFSRDEILEALWPNSSPAAAEQRLRTTVSLLRRALEPNLERGSDSRYILQRRPGYLFDRQAECRVDAWHFGEHQKMAESAREAGRLDEAIHEYRQALECAGGEFLAEDPYEEWAMEARQEWWERYLDVLSKLSECLAQKGRYTEAIGTCERALALDEYREELHRQLMLYHYAAGEQALALKAYRRYDRTLKEELGTAPSPELTRLKERIEARDVPGMDTLRRYPKPRYPLRFPYSLSRTHFVGRDREYALLAERLREAMEGEGGAVAVEGEAGVGKTRLVEEFLGYAHSRGVRVLAGRCYERELGAPLEPILEALGRVADIDEIVSEVSRSGAEESGHPSRPKSYDNARIYRALAGEIIRESQDDSDQALVLFVDDLQWADPATPEFLSYLARRISGERILLIFTYRRENAPELSGWLGSLAERRAMSALSLSRLSLENLTQILARMSSRGFSELRSLAGFLHRESEGNPFYAVEYLRWLIESEIVEIDSRRRLSGLESEMLREGALPSGVRSLIQARLGSLSEDARDLLELAAVIGRDYDLELLQRAAVRDVAGTFDSMKPLMASGLIVETSEEAYRLSHDKLRQVLYEGIDGPRRRTLHLRVAGALEEVEGEPAELAHHYLKAKEWRPALESLVLAATKAEDSHAWETALENYARSLEVIEKLPDPAEKRFDLLASRERLLERMDRREEERITALQEMLGLAKRLGDRVRIAEVHARRIGALAAVSDFEGAARAAQTAVAIFQELGDRAGETRVHREVGHVCLMNRDYAGMLEANFRALRIHRELGDRRGEVGDIHNISQAYLGMGDYDQALRWVEEAGRVHRGPGDGYWEEMLRTYTMASIHLDRGDLEAALRLTLEGIRLDIEFGRNNVAIPGHSRCGTLYLRLGRPEEALEHFRTAARLNREAGHTRDEGYSLMSVGACLEQTGDPASAAESYRRAIELLDIAYEESVLAVDLSGKADAIALLAGTLHRSLDRPKEALELYETAAETYRGLGDKHRLRRVLLNSAGLRWRMGNPEASARDYEEALELAREHSEKAHEAAALASLSVVYRDLGRLRESVRCGRAACGTLRDDLQDLQTEAYALTSLADSYERLGHHKSALSCLKRSLRLRRKVGNREGEVGALYDLARVYEKLGDAGRARASLEEAARKGGVKKTLSGMERRR